MEERESQAEGTRGNKDQRQASPALIGEADSGGKYI
jgi:hypothetical protein